MPAARSPIAVKPALMLLGFITLSVMLAGISLGQIKSGVIVGTVLDSSGAGRLLASICGLPRIE